MTSFSIGTNPTIGTSGPSELTNRIRLCILDMRDAVGLCVVSRLLLERKLDVPRNTFDRTMIDNSSHPSNHNHCSGGQNEQHV